MIEPAQDPESKAAWRARLSAARRALPADVRAAEASALVNWVGALDGDPVCCYLPIGTEPGSVAMVDALVNNGRRVLLPIVTGVAPLDWAEYHDSTDLIAGPYGLREPSGTRLGPSAVGLAELVLVPALAADRRGVRLGRGGGHYDRSLPLARTDARLIAVVRDAELVRRLPAQPHDVLMTGTLTPGRGLRPVE
ncbi:MAG TPA: 5-formyltetrahydrofolate cyclo-ligase [Pseudonocardiaceae bacterium]|nr:5-formyltetrahydrofolate cyclo-ligase [Pseudonocardiaceae bacterium]